MALLEAPSITDVPHTGRQPDTVRILIADDDERVRAALRRALTKAGLSVIADCDSTEGAVYRAAEMKPDVCLLDVRMPGCGVEAAARIREQRSCDAIVMLSWSADPVDVIGAVRAGANGYVLKGEPMDEIVAAVQSVSRGEVAFPGRFVKWVLDELRLQPRRSVRLPDRKAVELTTREWEVMRLLACDLSTSQIAARLFLSSATVRVHITNVVRKLKVTDRKEALALLIGAASA